MRRELSSGLACWFQDRVAWRSPAGLGWIPQIHLILKSEPEESPPTRVAPQTAPEEAQTGHDATSSTINTERGSTAPELPQRFNRPYNASAVPHHAERAAAARDLAFDYLDRWSAPNQVALASAPSFYGSTVLFHGKPRSFASIFAEKRRFAERWPNRTYRYRRETTQVACETVVAECTVWFLFDFSAAHPHRDRKSRGIGEHELVVSFVRTGRSSSPKAVGFSIAEHFKSGKTAQG